MGGIRHHIPHFRIPSFIFSGMDHYIPLREPRQVEYDLYVDQVGCDKGAGGVHGSTGGTRDVESKQVLVISSEWVSSEGLVTAVP